MTFGAMVALAFSGSLASWIVARVSGRLGSLVPALLPAGIFLSILSHWDSVTNGSVVVETIRWVPSLDIALTFRLDAFSFLFALLITGIGTLVTLYAGAYFDEKPARERARFLFLILLFMASMLGTVLSDNLMAMFVFWEATGVVSFMLIGFEAAKPDARRAALQSLLVTAGGGLALFAAILLIGMELGTFSLAETAQRSSELAASPYLLPIIILLLLGAFTKSAQFPFHFWLPKAMAAPTPASAYLHSATMVKLGVYLLARFDSVFANVPAFGVILVTFGSLTMLIAAINALRATGYKAILAHSTVASLGILVMLIGLPGETAAVATVGFLLSHALYKAALFFCAGNAIHATHITELRKLGGLVRFLPFTAAAAVLASLSMAGLPSTIGFISKEFLFEAQLASGWSIAPIAVAVAVNAVMVAIAGVVSLRPFFMGRDRISRVHHRETPGLLIGPLLLGSMGIVMGIAPGLFTNELVGPAASVLYGAPIDTSIALWHGLTPMLALSALAVGIGLILAWQWDRLHHAINRAPSTHLDADRNYHRLVDLILGVARRCTRTLQNGDQRRYSAVVAAATIAIAAWVMARGGAVAFAYGGPIEPFPTAVLLLSLIGLALAARSRSLVTALIGVGVLGYGSALIFLLNGAPDLALTQFAIETLVLVVIMAVLVRLPSHAPPTRSRREKASDAGLAAAFAFIMFLGLSAMLALPFDTRLSEYFGTTSYTEAQGRNVVNVVIVDYRAIDTLGEIAVVAFATLAAWVLLRRPKARERS